MPRRVEPKTFLVAETIIDPTGMAAALAELGVPDWAPQDPKSDAEALIEFAGKSCYMSFSTDLNKNLTKVGMRNNYDYIQQGLISTKHGSVLEHASVTFLFMNVSRVFTHELVRHRVGSAFSQVSGRYVRTDEIGYWLPSEVHGTTAEAYFHAAFGMMEKWTAELGKAFQIDDLKDFTLKKKLTSAFRRLIGNGQANHIVATFNHRTLRHLIELRTSRHAEEEIRIVFNQVYNMVVDRYPAIYADAKLTEIDGCNEVMFLDSKV